MIRRNVLTGLILLSILSCLSYKSFSQFNSKAAYSLINRIIPQAANHFKVEFLPQKEGKDVFELESLNGKIVLRGNNGVAVASALNYYLTHYCHCQITWNARNMVIPDPLPMVPEKVIESTPYKYRYYLNYTTFSYTMAWWDWDRWEQEIDWMALNGINMPLALTGAAAIWNKVYKSFGFDDTDLRSFFSGPAYFAWLWMGNLDGWGGPLSQHWMNAQESLQKKILERERELGMTPVLPAFSGHVPPSFKEKFPGAKLVKTIWGYGFDSTYIMDPADRMFEEIGKRFIEVQTQVFGTDHLYSADTFNENEPPTDDSTYLDFISRKIYHSMAVADPKAVWVMQGWMFFYASSFWKQPQIRALLNVVPDDNMIILDLNTAAAPVWKQTNGYYNKPWIWNVLSNGGGNTGLSGQFDSVAHNPAMALKDPNSGKMSGIGLTMEGIEQNPVFYQLMLENVWRNQPVDISSWLRNYLLNRYGMPNHSASKAWQILRSTVYSGSIMNGQKSIVSARPTFEINTSMVNTDQPYDPVKLLDAWPLFIDASDSLSASDGFQYDIVDVTRQILANYATPLQQKFAEAYRAGDKKSFDNYSRQFLELILDMDELLASRKDFLLGTWLASARRWGETQLEKDLYEFNARDQITLWGGRDCPIHDYACKQWSGLLKGFYFPRWNMFFNYVDSCMVKNVPVDNNVFEESVKDFEWVWVNGHDSYPDYPTGDPVDKAKKMYKKYKEKIRDIYINTKSDN